MMKYERFSFINSLKLSVTILPFPVGVIFLMDTADNDPSILQVPWFIYSGVSLKRIDIMQQQQLNIYIYIDMKNYLKMRSKMAQETMNLHHAIVQNVIVQKCK